MIYRRPSERPTPLPSTYLARPLVSATPGYHTPSVEPRLLKQAERKARGIGLSLGLPAHDGLANHAPVQLRHESEGVYHSKTTLSPPASLAAIAPTTSRVTSRVYVGGCGWRGPGINGSTDAVRAPTPPPTRY